MLVPSAAGIAAGTNEGASKVSDVLVFLLERQRLLEALRNSRDPQDETRAENVEELVAQTRDFDRENPGATPRRLPHPGVARRRGRRARRRVGHRLADDAAHRQGPRVPRRVPHRPRGGPAAAPDVGVRARRPRRGAAPVLRRHHPRPQAPVPVARDEPRPVRRDRGGDAVALPAGDPRGTHRLEAVARHGELARRHPAACAQRPARYGQGGGAGARATATSSGSASRRAPRPKTEWANRVTGTVRDNGDLTLAAGDRIRHVDFGEGRVTQVTGEGTKRIAHVRSTPPGRRSS